MLSLQKAHLLFTRGSPLSAEGKSRGSMCNFAVVCKFCSPSNVGERNLTKEGMALPSLPSASPFSAKGRCHGIAVTEGYVAGRKSLPASNSPCRSLSGAAFCMVCKTRNTPQSSRMRGQLPSMERGERQETQAFPASIRTRADTVPAFLRCAQKLAKGTVCTSPFDYRGGRFVPCPQICSVIPQKRLRRFL